MAQPQTSSVTTHGSIRKCRDWPPPRKCNRRWHLGQTTIKQGTKILVIWTEGYFKSRTLWHRQWIIATKIFRS